MKKYSKTKNANMDKVSLRIGSASSSVSPADHSSTHISSRLQAIFKEHKVLNGIHSFGEAETKTFQRHLRRRWKEEREVDENVSKRSTNERKDNQKEGRWRTKENEKEI